MLFIIIFYLLIYCNFYKYCKLLTIFIKILKLRFLWLLLFLIFNFCYLWKKVKANMINLAICLEMLLLRWRFRFRCRCRCRWLRFRCCREAREEGPFLLAADLQKQSLSYLIVYYFDIFQWFCMYNNTRNISYYNWQEE